MKTGDVTDMLAKRLQQTCDAIAAHVYEVSPQKYRIDSMRLGFKKDHIGALWCVLPAQKADHEGLSQPANHCSCQTCKRVTWAMFPQASLLQRPHSQQAQRYASVYFKAPRLPAVPRAPSRANGPQGDWKQQGVSGDTQANREKPRGEVQA